MKLQNKDRIQKILEEIVTVFAEQTTSKLPGLLVGNSGILLFLSNYYNHFDSSEKIANQIEELIYHISERMHSLPIPASFASGYSGIGWVFNYLIENGILNEEERDIIEDIAIDVNQNIQVEMQRLDMDALYGFMGDYTFLSESDLLSSDNQKKINEFLSTANQKHILENGFNDPEDGSTNLGLAHGLSSLGLFIINQRNLPQGILNLVVEKYLEIFKLQNTNHIENGLSVFPNKYNFGADAAVTNIERSRYAWCYGDLGILYFLLKLPPTDNRELKQLVNALVDSNNKRNVENGLVTLSKKNDCFDIGFCHGLSGIFYLQHKINRNLNPGNQLQTNAYWLELLLSNLELFLKIKDFKNDDTDDELKYFDSLGLLEGIAGAGLVLMSYLTGDYSWDHCLILND